MDAEKLEMVRSILSKLSETHGSGNVEVDLMVAAVAVAGSLVFLYLVALSRDKISSAPTAQSQNSAQPLNSDRASIIVNDLRSEIQRMHTNFDHEIQSLRKEIDDLRNRLHYAGAPASTSSAAGRERQESESQFVDVGLVSQIRDVFSRRSTI